MRKHPRAHFIAAAAAALCLANGARAQSPDTVATAPNVLLLVDTSGSMEWVSSGDVDPVCDPTVPNPTATTGTNQKSRWIELLEVLTGTIDHYSCYAQPRTQAANFDDEFRLGALPSELPYDLGYSAPYHRPLSNGCAPSRGTLPWYDGGAGSTPYQFQGTGAGLKAIDFHPFTGSAIDTSTTCTTFSQPLNDGLLDTFDGLIRFGLMTFDTRPSPLTGITGTTPDHPEGLMGAWTYYAEPEARCQRRDTAGTYCDPSGCCLGTPWDCLIPSAYEVGARNAAAPPWEGRMVGFGPSANDGRKRNSWIQQILLATRPYGATPIAGQLSDARDFLWHDTATDPVPRDPGEPVSTFGPYAGGAGDPAVVTGCRENFIVLLTDGQPNMDLRPACVNGADDTQCPYELPEDIADDLVTHATNPKVRTFVVGFAIGSAPGIADCATMTAAEEAAECASPVDSATAACCTLNKIALNGTPPTLRGQPEPGCTTSPCPPADHALFPQNPAELRSALSRIFGKFLTKVTGRTFPVTSSVSSGLNLGFQFTAGAKPQALGMWSGKLMRERIQCNTASPPVADVVPPDPTEMDDFIANVNRDPDSRRIFTVEPDLVGSLRHGAYSVRPLRSFPPINDGVGNYSGEPRTFDPASLAPESFQLALAPWCSGPHATCRNSLVDWAAGKTSAAPVTRCAVPGNPDCSVISDIFHSVPTVRPGRPAEFLRDETYAAFAGQFALRDTVLYTSSNDGFLHAFLVAPGDGDPARRVEKPNQFNNELWAFVPPAVLPAFQAMYPSLGNGMNRIPVLDGVPVIKDVAATQDGPRQLSAAGCTGGSTVCYPYALERKKVPDAGQNEIHTWRTVMVQAFGPQKPGYFAVDITKPTIPQALDRAAGPKFLWQLTTDTAGNQLFGRGGATPLITTVFVDTKVSPEPIREVAVAVLPGGIGDAPGAGPCGVPEHPGWPLEIDIPGSQSNGPASFRNGSQIRCYQDTPPNKNSTAARSVTIVRLDTGEIIRTFRPDSVTQPVAFTTGASGVVMDTTWDASGINQPLHIPAPIVGQPVAYPAQTGQIADRIFVGDAEGRIWRIDVSNPDPTRWAMNLFFDAYWDAAAPPQPVQTAPVVSVDEVGQITLAYSTGDQDNLTPDLTHKNYVVSLTEVFDEGFTVQADGVRKYKVRVNYRHELAAGERVLGPMTLFNKTLYFSTFLQSMTPGCNSLGTSKVYGLDYLALAGTPLGSPPAPGSVTGGGRQNLPTQTFTETIIAGVGLRQMPSCSATAPAEVASSDEFLGYGQLTTTTTAAPGEFQLVIQQGGVNETLAGAIPTQPIVIAAPVNPVRIDSWAPIIE